MVTTQCEATVTERQDVPTRRKIRRNSAFLAYYRQYGTFGEPGRIFRIADYKELWAVAMALCPLGWGKRSSILGGTVKLACMKRVWPKSGWAHAGIAFLSALISCVFVFIRVNNTHFARYAREYPHDGQDGLGAFMDALHAGALTLLGVFLLVFAVQRLLTAKHVSSSQT